MTIDNIKKAHATYHVGLKILLKKGEEFLFLIDAVGKHFDFPGGRIDETEHDTPLSQVIAREVGEEIGEDIKYKLGKPIFQFRRYFQSKNLRIFLTIYEAEYLSGGIKLSTEHSGYQWINPKEINLKKEEFFSEEEYLTFKDYFKKYLD